MFERIVQGIFGIIVYALLVGLLYETFDVFLEGVPGLVRFICSLIIPAIGLAIIYNMVKGDRPQQGYYN